MKKTEEDGDLLTQILSSFSCVQDKDIESFLHNRAVEFEKLSKARTYLICDADQLLADGFCMDRLIIYGYVSIALKVLSVPDEVSNRKRKEIDGLSAKIHGEQIKDFSCYLIGQLSRNSNVAHDSISGADLLQASYDVIAAAIDAVGGRYVMIECHEEQKLMDFYSANGFEEISRVADENRPMVQMIRKIADD